VHLVNSLHSLAPILSGAQSVVGVDAANYQNFSFQLDFAGHLRAESAVAGINTARFQRAPEGTGQSAPGRRHHVVQRRRVRGECLRRNFVVCGDLGVDSENHRVFFGRQVSEAHGAALPLDPGLGPVNDFVWDLHRRPPERAQVVANMKAAAASNEVFRCKIYQSDSIRASSLVRRRSFLT
jgi:hypothetical protein